MSRPPAAAFAAMSLLALPSCSDDSASNPRISPVVRAVSVTMPSVVNLSAHPPPAKILALGSELADGGRPKSIGSGSVIGAGGLILTSSHVLQDTQFATVTLHNGARLKAETVADDTMQDIALLRVDVPSGGRLAPIRAAFPGELHIGETTIAMGNPYGLGSSVSEGVLSATGRKVSYQGRIIFSDILQIDAPIYPGNSGGPLTNILGEMIGMNSSTHINAPGIGFAIPLERLENTLASWMTPERINGLRLGLTPSQKVFLSKASRRVEIVAEKVEEGSPAWAAGLRPGQVITKYDGRDAACLLEFSRRLVNLKADELMTLRVADGRTLAMRAVPMRKADGAALAKARLGIVTKDIPGQVARGFAGGVEVADPGDNKDAAAGDVIVKVGDMPVRSADDLGRWLGGASADGEVEALVLRPDKAGGAPSAYEKRNITLKARRG